MYFGADYYPEHWPRERWEVDASMMKEANLNIVRLAEFSWSLMEPQEGVYNFAWLDDAIRVLSAQGLKVVMCTPTATPPKWLMDKHPDIYQVDRFGRQRGFGSRRHYCFNSSVYREYTEKIVTALAEHFKDNESIVAWQIDNEFGCHDNICYCDNCLEGFKKWCRDKYGSIENLNAEWGTIFWSQTYRNWDELIIPAYTECDTISGMTSRNTHNPSLMLDFRRFSSDSAVDYQKLQIDIIKRYTDKPITHNLMGHFSDIDYYNLGKDLDFISWDNYIRTPWGEAGYKETSMAHDLMRGIKNKNFWVMEQQSGPCGWNNLGSTPAPGQLRLWSYQAVAHGADAIVYFRWRACTFGTEQYWYGILDHDGKPRRRYREIQQTGSEFEKLTDLFVGAETVTEAALIKSYDNSWCHGIQYHVTGFDYNKILTQYYSGLADNGISLDVTSADTDLSKYKLVVMPAFNLMSDDLKERLEKYVTDGGNLLVTFRSGTKDWNNKMSTDTLPGYFKNLAGVEVEEFDALYGDRTAEVDGITGKGTASLWCDVIKPETAKVLATYSSDFYKGAAAITANEFGKGKVFYVGCDLDTCSMKALMKFIAQEAGLLPVLADLPEGVEAVRRISKGIEYLMVMNHNETEAQIKLDGEFTDMITGEKVRNDVKIQPYGVFALVR